jgi:hypothetical protein
MKSTGSRQECSWWVSRLCSWLCHSYFFSIGSRKCVNLCIHISGDSLLSMSLHLRCSDLCLPVGSQVVLMHWCLLVHVTLVVMSSHSISECQEKQTPATCLFLGHGQSVVIRRIWDLYLMFGSTFEYHTLYTRGRVEFHGLLDEVMLLHTSLFLFLSCLLLENDEVWALLC